MKKFIDCVWTVLQLVGSGTERDRAGQSGEKAERDRAEWVCVGVRDTFFKVNDERIKTVR
jgi:hypothetical protein